ncbi:MAG: hypothetical protein ACM3X4_06060 [Ignavibacteriales bacterium]
MRRNGVVIAAVAVALLLGVAVLTQLPPGRVWAVPPEPGSQEDPLISKSYFDRFVSLQVVTVPAGKTLTCEAGTEIVLRAGKATAVGSDLGGLSDVTAGKDIQTGQAVTANHLLIVPRSDGRGLRASTEIVVMVRGAYAVSP